MFQTFNEAVLTLSTHHPWYFRVRTNDTDALVSQFSEDR